MYLRPISMPSTSLSETALSTPFNVSLTVSVAVFWAAKEVVKALGAKVAREAALKDVRAMKDIMVVVRRFLVFFFGEG